MDMHIAEQSRWIQRAMHDIVTVVLSHWKANKVRGEEARMAWLQSVDHMGAWLSRASKDHRLHPELASDRRQLRYMYGPAFLHMACWSPAGRRA